VLNDQRGPVIRALAESGRERYHWRGSHPDFPGVVFMFETVIDDGEHRAIRHLELHAGGTVLRYSWEHLEDQDGFLTDTALQPDIAGLARLAEPEFTAAWVSGMDPATDQ
jgi:hypothetical protein